MTDPVTAQLAAVLAEIAAERQRQDAKFGEQNHRDGTGGRRYAQQATAACAWVEAIDRRTATTEEPR